MKTYLILYLLPVTVHCIRKQLFQKIQHHPVIHTASQMSGMVWQQDNLGFQWDTIHYAYDTTEVFIDSSTQVCNIVPQGLVTNPPGTYFNNAAMMYIYVDTGQAVSSS